MSLFMETWVKGKGTIFQKNIVWWGIEYTYDEHWVMYRIVESLYCTPETNFTLYVNYIGIKIFLILIKTKYLEKQRAISYFPQLYKQTNWKYLSSWIKSIQTYLLYA